jgi:hypothetical protein
VSVYPPVSNLNAWTDLHESWYVHDLIKSIRTRIRKCNATLPVTHFPIVDINTGWGPPFAFMTARTVPGRLSTRCLNVSGGMAARSSHRAEARAVNVGRCGLERSRRYDSSHRRSVGFRSGLWAGQSISGTLLLTNYPLTDLALWQGIVSCWYRQLSSPNWSSTVDSLQRIRISLYTSVFRIPCSITRGPSPLHEKHPHTVMPPPPNFAAGTTHAGRYRSPGIRHAQTLPWDRHMV